MFKHEQSRPFDATMKQHLIPMKDIRMKLVQNLLLYYLLVGADSVIYKKKTYIIINLVARVCVCVCVMQAEFERH